MAKARKSGPRSSNSRQLYIAETETFTFAPKSVEPSDCEKHRCSDRPSQRVLQDAVSDLIAGKKRDEKARWDGGQGEDVRNDEFAEIDNGDRKHGPTEQARYERRLRLEQNEGYRCAANAEEERYGGGRHTRYLQSQFELRRSHPIMHTDIVPHRQKSYWNSPRRQASQGERSVDAARRFRLWLAICFYLAALGMSVATFKSAEAHPLAGIFLSDRQNATAIEKTHGFHCRMELGWDPRAGVYHYHRHEGICRDYKGCWRKSQRCIFLLGRGFGGWEWDRWGFDNWRYYSCMMRAGCY